MIGQRTCRGVPLPSAGLIIVVVAALVAAWLVWSKFGRVVDDNELSQSPVKGLHNIEAHVNRGAEAVPELLAALDSDDPQKRRLAAYGLGRIGTDAAQALAKLRQRLADDDPRVRENAAYAVANVDPDKTAAAAAIAPLMLDPQQNVRESVEKELLAIGSPAFETLATMLHTASAAGRQEVLHIFRNALKSYFRGWRDRSAAMFQAVRELLADSDAEVRIEAQTLLAEWHQATVLEIGELLRSGDVRRVGVAVSAAGYKKEEAAELLPDILVLLDRGPSGALLNTLRSMKAAARPAAARLIKLAETASSKEQLEIAQTLAVIDADPDDIVRILAPLLLEEYRQGKSIAWPAGELLLKVSPEGARRQVSLLIPKLIGDDGTVNKTVLFALHSLGTEAHEAVPALIPLLQSPDRWVAEFAAHALNRIGLAGIKAAPDLADIVKNDGRPAAQRIACANALASMGAGARSIVPTLLEVISRPDPTADARPTGNYMERDVRAAVVTALGKIGGPNAESIQALRPQLKSRSHAVRAAAADALGRVAGQSSEVLAELIPPLRDGMPIVRAQAALAISRSNVDRQTAVAPLIGILTDDNAKVRTAAAIALGSIGPVAKAALPVLQEVLTVPFDSGRDDSSHVMNIPEINHVTFEQAARTALTAIESTAENDSR